MDLRRSKIGDFSASSHYVSSMHDFHSLECFSLFVRGCGAGLECVCVWGVCAHFRVAMPLSCNYEILNADGLGLTGCVSSTCIDAIFGVPHHHRRQADIPACSGLPPLTKKDTVQLHTHRDTEARQFMVIAGGTRATQMSVRTRTGLRQMKY